MYHEVRAASDFLGSPPRCVVDVGANVGKYTQAWFDYSRAVDAGALIELYLFVPSPAM